jgi:hypothetical protein
MSGQEVTVDTDTMHPGMYSFTDVGNHIMSIYNQLFAAAQQYSGCWGADSTGEQFAAGYLPSADQVLQGIQTGGNTVLSTIQSIWTTIQGYTATEEDNTLSSSGFSIPDTGDTDSTSSDHSSTEG